MFETYNTKRQEVMAITSTQAIQLHKAPSESEGNRRETQNGSATQGSSGQGLSMVQAEKMLKGLVDEGWFEKSRKGFYSLSPRALMELRGWLIETYNDNGDEDEVEEPVLNIKSCSACKEIITVVCYASHPSRDSQTRADDSRANGVRRETVHVVCMTSARRTFSGCISRASVRFVRRIGPGKITLGRRLSQRLRSICRGKGEAEEGRVLGEVRIASQMRIMTMETRMKIELLISLGKNIHGWRSGIAISGTATDGLMYSKRNIGSRAHLDNRARSGVIPRGSPACFVSR